MKLHTFAAVSFFLASSSTAFANHPVIAHVDPRSGPTTGGTRIEITGLGLYAPPECGMQPGSCETTGIQIGEQFLEPIEFSSTRLVFLTRGHMAGTFDLTLIRSDGQTDLLEQGFTFGPAGVERFLIPVAIRGEAQGAFGSRWVTELSVSNLTNFPLSIVDQRPCPDTCPAMFVLPAGDATTFDPVPVIPGGGALIHVARDGRNVAPLGVELNLRVRDVSRALQTWGTELPIVRAEDTRSGFGQEATIQLLNVPTTAGFRQTLRVYDFDGPRGKAVFVHVYPMHSNELIAHTFLELSTAEPVTEFPMFPGYAQITNLSDMFPQIRGHERVRVVLGSAGRWLRFWGFVSVTNNETQHVTTITPQVN